ncbi:MAG: hypothetical protein QXP77_00920 [Candidatus Aenigmatarchaeota archaeon]
MEHKVSLIENPPSDFKPENFEDMPYINHGKLILYDTQIVFQIRKWLNSMQVAFLIPLIILTRYFFKPLWIPLSIIMLIICIYAFIKAIKKEKMTINIKDIKSISVHQAETGLLKIKYYLINIVTNDKNLWITTHERVTGENGRKTFEIVDFIKSKMKFSNQANQYI